MGNVGSRVLRAWHTHLNSFKYLLLVSLPSLQAINAKSLVWPVKLSAAYSPFMYVSD